MKRALLLFAFTCLSAPCFADPFFPDMSAARDAARGGNYSEAAANWAPLADFGIAEAQYELSRLYSEGKGVDKDEKKAFRLLRQSAEAGLPRAYIPLGRLYESGIGAPRNLSEAEKAYQQAQAGGDPRGAYHLGRMYERHPVFVPSANAHTVEADTLLKKIHAGQFAYAEQLGHKHDTGDGAAKDSYRALLYMTIAARAGSSTAAQRAAVLEQSISPALVAKAEKDANDLIVRVRAPGFEDAGAPQKFSRPKNKTALAPLPLPDKNAGYRAAADQYRRAVDAGYFRAARNLGQMYEKGRGVDQNKNQALTYYYVARDSGVEQAQSLVAAMESALDPPDIARARSDADTILASHPADAPAKSRNNPKYFGIVKTIATVEDNHDLGTRSDTLETGLGIDGRAGMFYHPEGADVRTYGEMRVYKSTGVIDTRDDDGDETFSDGFIELRQLWAEFYNLAGDPRLSTKLGRQRFREDRGLWWSSDIDAARLALDSTLTSGFIALGHSFDNYRIGDNDDFREDERNRLRLLGELGRRLTPDHTVEARFLLERDLSDNERTGDIFAADDIDRADADLLWVGLRAHGSIPAGRATIGYHLEGLAVTGEETVNDSTLGPGGGQRIITGTRKRDVAGWAVDSAVSLALFNAPLSPTITAGYAYGSGDDTPGGRGDDNAFRQTDMQGNTSLLSGDPDMGRIRHYGEVLRPELSNIHVLSLGAHVPVMKGGALALNYFNYWLDEKTGLLRSAGINAPLNGTDAYLGQAMDIVLYMPIADNMRADGGWMESIGSRFVIGGFKAGDAYGAAEDEVAWRGTAELRVRF